MLLVAYSRYTNRTILIQISREIAHVNKTNLAIEHRKKNLSHGEKNCFLHKGHCLFYAKVKKTVF